LIYKLIKARPIYDLIQINFLLQAIKSLKNIKKRGRMDLVRYNNKTASKSNKGKIALEFNFRAVLFEIIIIICGS